MLKVLVNIPFRDKYTGKVYEANKELTLEKERVEEIRSISADLVTVLGVVEETPKADKKETPKADKKETPKAE